MEADKTSEQTSASQASSGSEMPPYQPSHYTAEEVGQLLSWIADTLEAHDRSSKSMYKAVKLISLLDDESVTRIFGEDEPELTTAQYRVFSLAKALAKDISEEPLE